MFNRYITYFKPNMQFVVFLALMSMSWFVGAFMLEFLNKTILGYSSEAFSKLTEIPAHLSLRFKLVELLAMLIMLFMPAALFAYLAYPKPVEYLRINTTIKPFHLVLGVAIMLLAIPFSSLLENLNGKLPFVEGNERYTMLAKVMLSGTTWSDLMLNILAICIVPAIVEELFFRGCLQSILLKWMSNTPYTALFITAILFSAFHAQLSAFIPRVFLGLLLGLCFYFSGSIWVSIIMHIVNNLLTVVMVFLFNNGKINVDVSAPQMVNIWLGLASGVVIIGLVYYYYTKRIPYRHVEVEQIDDELKLF
jgi:membrane protease YdiL (CAAX protease family)